MKPLALPKTLLLRKPWEYRKVYQDGKRLRGPQLTIIHLANGTGESRLGISIHGISQAVRRNRIKRIIREFFRLNRRFIVPAADLVFAVRPGFAPDSPQDVQRMVERMLRTAGTTDGRRADAGRVVASGHALKPAAVPDLTQ